MSLSDLEIAKSNFIARTFVQTADENYCVSRWARQNKLYTDFAWSAVHSLEKYMKAILLSNGLESQKHGHQILKLFADVSAFCGDLIPDHLEAPPTIPNHVNVRQVDVKQFLSTLYEVGNSDARYGISGHFVTFGDLPHLDSLVYSLRRVICPLDEKIEEVTSSTSYREWLKDHPDDLLSRRGLLWERIETSIGGTIGSAANCNLRFAPTWENHDWSWVESSWRESPLERDIYWALQSDDSVWAKQGVEFSNWLLDNVKLGRPREDEIRKLITQTVKRHGL